jgi:hypothetical protein
VSRKHHEHIYQCNAFIEQPAISPNPKTQLKTQRAGVNQKRSGLSPSALNHWIGCVRWCNAVNLTLFCSNTSDTAKVLRISNLGRSGL